MQDLIITYILPSIDQILLAMIGVSSIYFLSSKDINRIKYGFMFGLLAEPLWFYTSYTHEQYGIMFLAICYGTCHIRGLYNCYHREKINPVINK